MGPLLNSERYSRLTFVRRCCQQTQLDDTGPGQLLINATDFSNGTRIVFERGHSGHSYPLSRVVAASAAFPGAFEPVIIDGRPYVD